MSEYASHNPLEQAYIPNVVPDIQSVDDEYDVDPRNDIDRACDLFGSYDEARRHIGVEQPEPNYEVLEGSEEPIAVNLRARAFALQSLMAYYNQLNKSRGASTVRQLHINPFDGRYKGEASDVESNMYRKLNNADFERNIEILVAADALRSNGIDEDVVELEKVTLKSRLNAAYGPGKAKAEDRRKFLNTTRETAGLQPIRKSIPLVRPTDEAA